eukprot:7068203-Prymnesium_polylepis.1
MANKDTPAVIKLLVAKLKPKLTPELHKRGLAWSDVQPALELVDNAQLLREAIEQPKAFLEDLEKNDGAAAIKLLVAKLRPGLTPVLEKRGLSWGDMQSALELVDSAQELRDAISQPDAFLTRLADAAGPATVKLLIVTLKPVLTPVLEKRGLSWGDVQPALELVDS